MADAIAYLEKHGVSTVLNDAVNALAKELPAEPYTFLINLSLIHI